jgi:hypothetical protein
MYVAYALAYVWVAAFEIRNLLTGFHETLYEHNVSRGHRTVIIFNSKQPVVTT